MAEHCHNQRKRQDGAGLVVMSQGGRVGRADVEWAVTCSKAAASSSEPIGPQLCQSYIRKSIRRNKHGWLTHVSINYKEINRECTQAGDREN